MVILKYVYCVLCTSSNTHIKSAKLPFLPLNIVLSCDLFSFKLLFRSSYNYMFKLFNSHKSQLLFPYRKYILLLKCNF